METPEQISNAGAAAGGSSMQLLLATGAFTVCFSVFGSVSAMMPIMKARLGLEPIQVSIAIATPVLLGSLGRIPLGILTDRRGGRMIFPIVMFCSVVPALLMGVVDAYWQVIACGLLIGIALASFSVGAGFVSNWYPPRRQGFALGVYGAGNIGQSLAAYGAPLIAGALGFVWGFWVFAALTLCWSILFLAYARNAPRRSAPKSLADSLAVLRQPMSWTLSLFYFLTFGGFVAMSIYLPTLLTDLFKLTPGDAGTRTAGFVLLATAMRPLGGILADRIGGRAVLIRVFPVVMVMACLMTASGIVPFTIGALGAAAAIGAGNGAVFRLVPEYFPSSVGSVTGLVGAAGGLGGFFPPLVLGALRQSTGSFSYGFVMLALFAFLCLIVCWRLGSRPSMPIPATT
ncbi:MAG TPA: MFS transporter [Candidatus Kapabacteria bacterium]|nr:MFS transporter [Candidatus Kapabacteria bacterium]